MSTRRKFLGGVILAGAASGLASRLAAGPQQAPTIPQEPKPGQDTGSEDSGLPSPEKRILEENQKNIKKKVDRLYQLAAELKAEVDKTDSIKVLSLSLMKKAEEVEKLAREIKNRSRG